MNVSRESGKNIMGPLMKFCNEWPPDSLILGSLCIEVCITWKMTVVIYSRFMRLYCSLCFDALKIGDTIEADTWPFVSYLVHCILKFSSSILLLLRT